MSEPTKDCICHPEFVGMAINCPKCNGGAGIPATPLPAPDPMDEVVGRVTHYLDLVRAFVKRDDASEMLDEPEYFATLDHADLRKLLAAYQSVRSENARMLEAINWACGTREGFDPPMSAGRRYWWRSELVRRAGLAYNAEMTSYEPRTGGTE
jgi:hypothetical protein